MPSIYPKEAAKTPVEALTAMREFFDADPTTWGQHRFFLRYNNDLPACACMLGALRVAVAPSLAGRVETEDSDLFQETVGILGRVVGPRIWEWNDAPGRTFEEVRAAIDTAIEIAKALAAPAPALVTEANAPSA